MHNRKNHFWDATGTVDKLVTQSVQTTSHLCYTHLLHITALTDLFYNEIFALLSFSMAHILIIDSVFSSAVRWISKWNKFWKCGTIWVKLFVIARIYQGTYQNSWTFNFDIDICKSVVNFSERIKIRHKIGFS